MGGWVRCGGLGGWPPRFLCHSWHFENCASIDIDDVLAEDGGQLHVLALAVHLNFLGHLPDTLG